MAIIPLEACKNLSNMEVGGKAYWLSQICDLPEYNVPPGICLTTEVFFDYLQNHPCTAKIDHLLVDLDNNPIAARRNLSLIRSYLESHEITACLIEQILLELAKQHISLKKGVAVRSSAVTEDGITSNFAGIYRSTLFVKDIETLKAAILATYCSNFSEEAYFYKGTEALKQSMAVIIQEMRVGDYYGILFSENVKQDFWRAEGDASTMILECSVQPAQVTDGGNPDISIEFSRTRAITNWNQQISASVISQLRDLAISLEKITATPVDLEFVLKGNRVNLVQYRPAKSVKRSFEQLVILDEDDVDNCLKVDFGLCNIYYRKYLGKQYLFRKVAREEGFKTYKNFYLIGNRENIAALSSKQLKKHINSDYVIVGFGKKKDQCHCKVEEIKSVVLEMMKKTEQFQITCRLGQMIPPEFSGYCSLLSDGKVLVEFVPYAMEGLIKGTMVPTVLIIDSDLSTEYIRKPFYEKILCVDEETGSIVEQEYGGVAEGLTRNYVERIYNYTLSFSGRFKEPRLEWYFYNDHLYAKDLSIEEKSLDYDRQNANIISIGVADGEVFHLRDLSQLDLIAQEYNLSLVKHEASEEQVYENELISEILEKIKMRASILFVERPSKGLLIFCEHAKGFVFKEGSVLSHIGISLREKNIPAIIDPAAYEKYTDGAQVYLSINGVIDGLSHAHL